MRSDDGVLNAASARWEVWRAVPRVELWEAVALSFGIDPHTWDDAFPSGMTEAACARLHPEFWFRLRVARGHIGGTLHTDSSGDYSHRAIVRLSVFFEWADRFGWDVPIAELGRVGPEESKDARAERIYNEYRRLVQVGTAPKTRARQSAAVKQLAAEEAVTEVWIRKLVARGKELAGHGQPTEPMAWTARTLSASTR